MASDSRSWIYRSLDAISFSCILVSIEEWIRSRVGVGPPSSLYFQLTIFVIGLITGWFGDAGPKVKARLSQLIAWFRKSKDLADALAENADLKKRLAHEDTPSIITDSMRDALKTAPRLLVDHTAAHPDREDLGGAARRPNVHQR